MILYKTTDTELLQLLIKARKRGDETSEIRYSSTDGIVYLNTLLREKILDLERKGKQILDLIFDVLVIQQMVLTLIYVTGQTIIMHENRSTLKLMYYFEKSRYVDAFFITQKILGKLEPVVRKPRLQKGLGLTLPMTYRYKHDSDVIDKNAVVQYASNIPVSIINLFRK
jgi:hypothetical protein